MHRRFYVSPEARRPYHPGQYSAIYRSLEPRVRHQLDLLTDEVFAKKTGITRKIDEHNPADRTLVRQWLLIRDAIVSWYLYNKILQEDHVRGLQEQIEAGMKREEQREEAFRAPGEAQKLRRELAETVERGGLPPEMPESTVNTVLQVAHIAHTGFDLMEVIAVGLPHASHFAHVVHTLSLPMAFIGLPLNLASGLYDIAEAHEAGDRDAERSAFRYGFASELVYGRIANPLSSASILGRKQAAGQRAAQRLLALMQPLVRERFLAVYRGPQRYPSENMDRALHDVGAF